jgi:Zn-dependent peptidase ImmA (M78 family)/transcriptional regulator with XRE-family HTH domain
MSHMAIETQADLGRRIAEAREGAGRTQTELATLLGIDRTAFSRIEAGTRKVSATELVAIASALERPIDWFVIESPPAVVSRRRDPAVGGFSRRLDLALEDAARDVSFLVERGVLTDARRTSSNTPESYGAAENLAREIRVQAGLPDGPILDLQAVCESLGLVAFSLALGPDAGDAAYVEVGNLGVAIVNGSTAPGRRRFSIAHELGHHLVGDAYEPRPRIGTDETESMFNAFAAYFLMPRAAVIKTWTEFCAVSSRFAAIAIAVRFRVSWTAACNQLRNLDLIEGRERDHLVETELTKGEVLGFGERSVPELEPPAVPPQYARAVVNAYTAGRLTPARTIELLHGTLTWSDLPPIEDLSLDQLRREFETSL